MIELLHTKWEPRYRIGDWKRGKFGAGVVDYEGLGVGFEGGRAFLISEYGEDMSARALAAFLKDLWKSGEVREVDTFEGYFEVLGTDGKWMAGEDEKVSQFREDIEDRLKDLGIFWNKHLL